MTDPTPVNPWDFRMEVETIDTTTDEALAGNPRDHSWTYYLGGVPHTCRSWDEVRRAAKTCREMKRAAKREGGGA